jgi:hypothetical protein
MAVEAAKKYNRIVQHGTQSRSSRQFAQVVEVIKSGKLGKLLVSRGLCYKSGLGSPLSNQGQTPSSQIAIFDYGDTQLIFEVRGLPSKKYQRVDVGNTFHLEGGTIVGNQFFPKGHDKAEPLPPIEESAVRGRGGNHFANFIEAVRSRKCADLNAPILEGHYSAALCHLANMSYRLGEPVPFNPRTKAFGDNKEAYETLARLEDYLKENHLNLDESKYQLGRKLTLDVPSETIAGDEEANKLLSRNYRKPFVVPEKIV